MEERIFGLTWEQIQRAQHKLDYMEKVDMSKDGKPMPTKEDVELLRKYGKEGLEKMQFFGVLDRLSRLEEVE